MKSITPLSDARSMSLAPSSAVGAAFLRTSLAKNSATSISQAWSRRCFRRHHARHVTVSTLDSDSRVLRTPILARPGVGIYALRACDRRNVEMR
jgi:hypothetical protein